ncbi:MAG: minor capsid protein [Peptostreptococcaceae bacterium]|nr:minor capsid protein [Peptostreptococcaceae bacterium]
MKSREYWTKRFEEIEKSSNQIGLDTYSQIEPAFLQAQRNIQKEIDSWYARFAANNKVIIQDARRMLSRKELDELKWDVNEFIKYGKENALDKQWMKELENASAKFHISKLEALKLRTQQAMEVAFGNELDVVDKMARKILTEDYYKSIFEIQKGFNIGFDVGQIDERKLNLLVNKPWATDGKNFSNRIWERKRQMVSELQQELTRTLIQGKSPDEAIRHMEKFVKGKVKNAKNAAGRLVMTEQAYFHSVSQKEAFNELDVEEFEIVATLDSHTSEICQEMDGKHFPMTDYQPGVTAPPFHVYCRSVTAPYFNDEWSIGERAARNEDGETYYVPESMKYKDWKQSFVDGGSKDELKNVEIPLTKEQLEAVEYYVSGDGMYINDYLRNRNNPIERIGEMRKEDRVLIEDLSNATNRKHDNSVLYRSIDATAVFGDISENDWESLRAKLIYNIDDKTTAKAQSLIDKTKGKKIIDKGFMSTTKDFNVAADFGDFTGSDKPIVIEFTNANKVKGFDVEKHLPNLEKRMEQSEVLLHNNSKYTVKDIIVKNDEYGKHIHVIAEFDDIEEIVPNTKLKIAYEKVLKHGKETGNEGLMWLDTESKASVKPSFIPATTKQEAEEFAKQFGVDADYSKYDISVANAVNETMQRATDEFGRHALDNLKMIGVDISTKKREGGFDWFSGKLSLSNVSSKNALFKMGEKTRKANARYARYGMKYFSAESDLSTIYHEIGHAIHSSLGGSLDTTSTSLDREIINALRGKTNTVEQVSYYATTNYQELIAECVAQYFDGEVSEITSTVIEILKKYGKKVI